MLDDQDLDLSPVACSCGWIFTPAVVPQLNSYVFSDADFATMRQHWEQGHGIKFQQRMAWTASIVFRSQFQAQIQRWKDRGCPGYKPVDTAPQVA